MSHSFSLTKLRDMCKSIFRFAKIINEEYANMEKKKIQQESELESKAPISAKIQFEIDALKHHIDIAFYLSRNPNIITLGIDPVLHYCVSGWMEGLDPAPNFSTNYYLEVHQDIKNAKVNPFWHYIVAGAIEGRKIAPSGSTLPSSKFKDEDSFLTAIRNHFDTEYYLRRNPDVAENCTNPLDHYYNQGWKEGRDPHPEFSTQYYLDSNPDVVESGLNPFWHYIVAGKTEGRMASHPGGYRAEILANLLPFEQTVNCWRKNAVSEHQIDAEDLVRMILDATDKVFSNLLISISHDNYREVPGGVQYCVQRDETAANERGIVFLNLHPSQPLPRLALMSEDPDPSVELLLDGTFIGAARISVVVDSVRMLASRIKTIDVVIHHLMGHLPEQIEELILATGRNDCWFWLHDFFALCPSFALQRNAVSFCGAPSLKSNACTLCLYGEERVSHLNRIRRFFERVEVHALSPSDSMANYWKSRADLPEMKISSIPHMTLHWKHHNKARSNSSKRTGPIVVAFVGSPAPHKGWAMFLKLVNRYRTLDTTYQFVYFGMADVGFDGLEVIKVQVTSEDPAAMTRAMLARDVDVLLHWASWFETFSFSTFEAIAAGAYIITNSGSGNIAATVREKKCGAILSDEADLIAFFEDGRLKTMVAKQRSRLKRNEAKLTLSSITFAAIDQARRL
jgi:glycosyltransferase involved in cell wall biosynthesis